MILEPGDPLRRSMYRTSLLHARQYHSGAPWHPDYRDEMEALDSNRLPDAGKSTFDSFTFIDDAIEQSKKLPALVSYNGNLIVLVDFGHEIGFDVPNSRRTSVATVVIKQSGELLTVYPGLPSKRPESKKSAKPQGSRK
jgi:hypothetical protein